MPSRRAFLITGAASVAIVGGGLFGARIFLADSSEAREPWAAAAEGFGDTRLDILAYAILAPNPHNRQPLLNVRTTPTWSSIPPMPRRLR